MRSRGADGHLSCATAYYRAWAEAATALSRKACAGRRAEIDGACVIGLGADDQLQASLAAGTANRNLRRLRGKQAEVAAGHRHAEVVIPLSLWIVAVPAIGCRDV